MAVIWLIAHSAFRFKYYQFGSIIERLFLVLSNSKDYFSCYGIATMLILTSHSVNKTGASGNAVHNSRLKYCKLILYLVSIYLVAICTVALMHPSDLLNWSEEARSMAMPIGTNMISIPISSLLEEMQQYLNPIQATMIQLGALYVSSIMYGTLYFLAVDLSRKRDAALYLCMLFHVIGLVAVYDYSPWAVFVLHNIFFIQHYPWWNPIIYSRDLLGYGVAFILISVAVFIAGILLERRKNYVKCKQHQELL